MNAAALRPPLKTLPRIRAASLIAKLWLAALSLAPSLVVAQSDTISWAKPYLWLPDGQTTPGSTITLQSSVPPAPNTTYQWYFNGAPITGATGSELTLSNLTVAQTGNYHYVRTLGIIPYTSELTTVNVRAQTEPPSPIDPSFVAGFPADGLVRVPLGVAADDTIVVIEPASGAQTRLRADGSIDPSWMLPVSAGTVIHVAADGSVITARAPYRFDRHAVAQPLVLPAGFDPATSLAAATAYPDGRVLIAQTVVRTDTFSTGPSLTRSWTKIARLFADGTVDPAFSSGESAGLVTKLTLDASERILVGRHIAGLTPVYGSTPVTETTLGTSTTLTRLTATGAVDATFTSRTVSYPWFLSWSLRNDGRILTAMNRGVQLWTLLDPDGQPIPGAGSQSSSFENYTIAPDGWFFGVRYPSLIERWSPSVTPTRDLAFYPGIIPDRRAPNGLRAIDTNRMLAWGNFTSWSGHNSNYLFRLRTRDVVTPQFQVTARVSATEHDIPTQLLAEAQGEGGNLYEWIALDGQALPAERFSATLNLGTPHYTKLGRYQVRVTGYAGTLLSQPIDVKAWRPLHLFGLSGRAEVGTGEDVLIAGAVVQTSPGWPQKILVRGLGPALRQYGLDTAVSDPALAWFDASGNPPTENDNWSDTEALRTATASAGLAAFASGSTDSALLQTWVTPGNYTVHLRNRSAQDGIGLLELYDLGDTRVGQLDSIWGEVAGLSLRARVGTGEKVAIGGFTLRDPHELGGGRYQTVLIRATGPTLAQYGIAKPLSNPRLTLYDAAGQVLASNDDWSTNVNWTQIFNAANTLGLGALPAGSKDAALLVHLPAGPYTAQVSSGDGTTGVALLEIYRVR